MVKFSLKDERSICLQLEKFFLHDACYLIIVVLEICITKGDSISNNSLNYNVLNIIFVVVSAYGKVGISMGYSFNLSMKLIKQSEGNYKVEALRIPLNGNVVLSI